MKLAGICALALFFVLVASGCMHSHVIEVTVTNTSSDKVSNVTVDYPEATFGINLLLPGKSFHYKIKPTATGTLKIAFINARGQDRKSDGPVVHKGDEGTMEIRIEQEKAVSDIKMKTER
jgi:hypothetical protein